MSCALRPARPEDAPACAEILREWIEETAWFPTLHPPSADTPFLAGKIGRGEVTVAVDAGRPVGFVAVEEDYVNCLYVAARARGQGVGRRLLDAAKARADRLHLWTFQANRGAQAFYLREGFREVRRTDGAGNEEHLPDIEFAWQRGDAP